MQSRVRDALAVGRRSMASSRLASDSDPMPGLIASQSTPLVPRCLTRRSPCATALLVARRALPHCSSAPHPLPARRSTAPLTTSSAPGTGRPPSGHHCPGPAEQPPQPGLERHQSPPGLIHFDHGRLRDCGASFLDARREGGALSLLLAHDGAQGHPHRPQILEQLPHFPPVKRTAASNAITAIRRAERPPRHAGRQVRSRAFPQAGQCRTAIWYSVTPTVSEVAPPPDAARPGPGAELWFREIRGLSAWAALGVAAQLSSGRGESAGFTDRGIPRRCSSRNLLAQGRPERLPRCFFRGVLLAPCAEEPA